MRTLVDLDYFGQIELTLHPSGGLVIDVLQLTFVDTSGGIEASSPHLIYRTLPIFDLYVPAVELRDSSAAGLAAIMVEDNFDHLFMVFVDYRRGITLEVNTSLRPSEVCGTRFLTFRTHSNLALKAVRHVPS